jgi:hypothetical protein
MIVITSAKENEIKGFLSLVCKYYSVGIRLYLRDIRNISNICVVDQVILMMAMNAMKHCAVRIS